MSYEVVEATFSKPGDVAEDHPLASAFEQSHEDGTILKVSADDPEDAAKVLRRYAAQTNRSVRIQLKEDGVVFQAKERITRNRGGKNGGDEGE